MDEKVKALAAAILPCPFCGLAPDTEIYRRNTGEFYRGAIYYFCEDHTDLMSLEHWNRRVEAAVPVIVDKFAYVTLPDPMAGRKDVYTLYKIPLFGNHRVKIIGREITLDIVNKLIRQAKEQP